MPNNDPNSLYDRARKAAGLDRVGSHTDAFMQSTAEKGGLADDQRLKCRYLYVHSLLGQGPDDREKWEEKRQDLEKRLMERGIRPSSLLAD